MDNGGADDGTVAPTPSRRGYLHTLAGLTGAGALAGCSSDDVDPPEQVDDESDEDASPTATDTASGGGTPEQSTGGTAGAALGDVIEGDRLALVAYSAERTTTVGEYSEADDGNEFVVVDMAAKNKADSEYINFSSFLQLTVRDSESYEYDQSFILSDAELDSGELAPGEVTRGIVAFEVPREASGLTLTVDLDDSLFSYDSATVDLDRQGSGRTLTQDLAVPVYDLGDTVAYEDTELTVNSVWTSMGSDYFTPDAGNEFVVIDITVANTGSEELTVSTLLQLSLKSEAGRSYDTSFVGSSVLDREFSQGTPIQPDSKRRGEIAFEAPRGLSPLYLVMDFDYLAEGDRTFFELR
ncbi:DUF4352 domain-containing protein [Haloarcula salinisoli]|uniref:DUF4352 domain-containing protein n=1 Tax=Haloarcula salinisoli TaxID=2487746 RepID=A0A8J7YH67_9EURY|nr:DUF4352 domain-containing protein [Halomicroarcula salinisoli]MBX0285862.1 DUF4352 domain-containing protein [Halomicroarcula salinisoli]MBX0302644.1 DUF4352 domain-containing protein [Halomicroarcula salinisoli]